jgi:predicted Co/Zn/Cd cation transporter (cation efflux family)
LLHAAQRRQRTQRDQAALAWRKRLRFQISLNSTSWLSSASFGATRARVSRSRDFSHGFLSVLTVKRFWRDSFILKIKLYAINHPVFQDDNGQTSLTLDLDALRSFVTGIECGSFALAASRLCRSTSAVSAQLKSWNNSAMPNWW